MSANDPKRTYLIPSRLLVRIGTMPLGRSRQCDVGLSCGILAARRHGHCVPLDSKQAEFTALDILVRARAQFFPDALDAFRQQLTKFGYLEGQMFCSNTGGLMRETINSARLQKI